MNDTRPNGSAPASRGRLFVISAPSGAGKTTLVRKLLQLRPDLRFSISYTTRPKRGSETDGKDYFFVSEDEFAAMCDANEFLEHAEVFGKHYGTSRRQVEAVLDRGQDVVLEIDWQGARQVRQNMPECLSIFILPPSLEELERRLYDRATDSAREIARRLAEAVDDITHWTEFDYAVINEDLDAAAQELLAITQGTAEGSRSDVGRRVGDMLAARPGAG